MKKQLQLNGVVVPEKIHLVDVKITNAQINSSITTAAEWDKLTLNMASETLFNEEYMCRLSLTLDMERPGEDGQPPLIKANFSIDFDFQIDNIMELILVDKESKAIMHASRELGISLMGIAYSTARGIILTRTGGTVLNGLVLPVVDTAKLFDSLLNKQA